MPFYRVDMSAANYCGFDSSGFFEAENENELIKSQNFQAYCESMQDYIDGWLTAEDYAENEDANSFFYSIEEIDKEEYEDYIKNMGEESWQVG